MTILALLMALTVSSQAMSYEQARQQALFLTDKMAYELNMTDDQYEAAFEINLDYLMSVNTYDDLYGPYWRYRNLDLSYVLLDWQYRAFCNAAYFYRPLYFSDGFWHFSVYARYPHRDYFYFDRPRVYVSYRGGHSWAMNHGRSWYDGRHFGPRPGDRHFGMRDGFDRGDFGRGNRQTFGSRAPQNRLDGTRQNRVNSRPGDASRPGGAFGSRNNSRDNGMDRPGGNSGRPNSSFGNGSDSRPNSSFGNSFGSRGSSSRTTVKQQPSPSDITNGARGLFGTRRSGGSSTPSTPRSTFSRPGNQGGTMRQQSAPSRSQQRSEPSGGSRGSFGSRR